MRPASFCENINRPVPFSESNDSPAQPIHEHRKGHAGIHADALTANSVDSTVTSYLNHPVKQDDDQMPAASFKETANAGQGTDKSLIDYIQKLFNLLMNRFQTLLNGMNTQFVPGNQISG